MTDAPLFIDDNVKTDLAILRAKAAGLPVNMIDVARLLMTKQGKREHIGRMEKQTVVIPGPWPFYVTFSIETGHPVGTCRHMSMSILRKGRVPHPVAVWMVAELLGFQGGLETCKTWLERLSDGRDAINVVQPLAMMPEATT